MLELCFWAKLLAVPVKMAPVVSGISDTATIKDRLEEAIREALDELANYNPTVDPVRTGAVPSAPVEGEEEPEKPKRGRGRPRKIDKLKE